MSENLHLTLDERNYIEQELMKNTTFTEIAKWTRGRCLWTRVDKGTLFMSIWFEQISNYFCTKDCFEQIIVIKY